MLHSYNTWIIWLKRNALLNFKTKLILLIHKNPLSQVLLHLIQGLINIGIYYMENILLYLHEGLGGLGS
jgi:hypothetical protein